jgi:hypothetical protein
MMMKNVPQERKSRPVSSSLRKKRGVSFAFASSLSWLLMTLVSFRTLLLLVFSYLYNLSFVSILRYPQRYRRDDGLFSILPLSCSLRMTTKKKQLVWEKAVDTSFLHYFLLVIRERSLTAEIAHLWQRIMRVLSKHSCLFLTQSFL